MQGLWKERVSGWNHKDSKRKRQTRNNTLRDRGRAILKVYEDGWRYNAPKTDKSKFRDDVELVYTAPLEKPFKEFKCDVWIVLVDNFNYGNYSWSSENYLEFMHYGKTRTAYSYNNKWWDYYDNSQITGNIKGLHKVDEFGINWDEGMRAVESPYHRYGRWCTGDVSFIYNKPLPHWKRMTFYNDGKIRKSGQQIANSMDRSRVRDYINKGDWDKEIQTHAYSKSISWYVH